MFYCGSKKSTLFSANAGWQKIVLKCTFKCAVMSSTGIIGSLNWAATGQGGLYKASLVSMRVAGWLHFVLAMLMFVFAVIGLIAGIAGAGFMAEVAGQSSECDQECEDWIRGGGAVIGIVLLLVFGTIGGIFMIFSKLESVAARRMAQCCEAAKTWFMVLGILSAIGVVFALISFDIITLLIDAWFVVAFLVFPLLADVKNQLVVPTAEAQAMERGVRA